MNNFIIGFKTFFKSLPMLFISLFIWILGIFGFSEIPPKEVVLPVEHAIISKNAMPDTYAATDALGRELPGVKEAGKPRENKFVGVFYWTWHASQSKTVTAWSPGNPINVQKVLDLHPEAANDINSPYWGRIFMPHHWNEPLFGYYDTDDRWVLRKHAEMLANAGVDVIIFDNTNGTYTWKESYDVLFEVFSEARKQGVNTPKISFILPFSANDDSKTQLHMLYDDIYSKGRYQDLWFYWEGKPLLMAYPDNLDINDKTERNIRSFFTFRPAEPSYTKEGTPGKWGWLSVYPQAIYRNPNGSPEQITVGVAQNHSSEKGITAMNDVNVFGRAYTSKGYDTRENAELYGANFQEQWEYALKVDPDFVFVTGFNEWVAGRHDVWQGVENAFPDQYNDKFSRDIEPSKGRLSDNYYYQLCNYIRLYKGVNPLPKPSGEKTVDLSGDLSQWNDVLPAYYAYEGNTFERNDEGYGGIIYTNNTGRNDIILSKIARDKDYIYFMVKCKDTLTSKNDPAWMRLFISTGSGKSWEGYQYIVNRASPGEKATLERSSSGWSWKKAADIDYSISGDTFQLKIPKSALGISNKKFHLNFKWSDNMQNDGDIMDFYQYGDTAPLGRFQYQYKVK